MPIKHLRIATRGSKLALCQAKFISTLIEKKYPETKTDFIIVKTKGDKILDVPLAKIGGKGLFVKEIEEKLILKEADFAVHSMKDVPMELPEGLKIGVVPKREDPSDCLVSKRFNSLNDLPVQSVIGTSSLRRTVQTKWMKEDVIVSPLRGNLDTRIKRLYEGKFDAIIVAYAGLKRLNLSPTFTTKLDPLKFIPAVGQGALGIEYREDNEELEKYLYFLDDPITKHIISVERDFLKTLQGGCQVPIGGYCYLKDSTTLGMIGFLSSLDGSKRIISHKEKPLKEFHILGREVAEDILKRGGEEILKEIYSV